MNNDILWLARLGLDQGLFTRQQAAEVRAALGPEAEIGDFAQKLLDDAIVEDLAGLERLAGLAMAKGRNGPPVGDPFAAEESRAPFAGDPAAGAGAGDASAAAKPGEAGPAPQFCLRPAGCDER